ncbi:hypothetical protein D3C87_1604050 [compost metagenome]|jgi:hypothetical protein
MTSNYGAYDVKVVPGGQVGFFVGVPHISRWGCGWFRRLEQVSGRVRFGGIRKFLNGRQENTNGAASGCT